MEPSSWLNLFKADMDSIVRKLDRVDWEDDSGAAFAELIRLKTLEVCTLYNVHPKKSQLTVPPIRSVETEEF